MPAYQLSGQAALVTGAASGIGYATAAMLGRGGARVAVNSAPPLAAPQSGLPRCAPAARTVPPTRASSRGRCWTR